MKSEIEKYIYPNYFAKGYPLLTTKVNEIWANILNILINCFEKEFNDITIVNNLPLTYDMTFVSRFYGKYFKKIEEMIPTYINDNNVKKVLLTDKLPAVVSYLKDNKLDNLIATYSVVRPRSFGLRTYLYEEFIRYFQMIVSTEQYNEREFTQKIRKALEEFFSRINLHVVLCGRISESYYSKKSTYFSVWLDNRITDILQCGLLRKNVVESIYILDKPRLIMDIGGTQRLITAWIYANSDKFGLKFPREMRQYDILLEVKQETEINKKILELCKEKGYRVLLDKSLGKQKINKIRNLGYSQSVDILLLQRIQGKKEFYNLYYRDGRKITIDSLEKLINILNQMYDNTIVKRQKEIMDTYIEDGQIYPSTYFGKLPVMDDNLFIEEM